MFWLLLTGDVPTVEQTEALTADWTARRDQRKDWWWSKSSKEIGGLVGSVLRALPCNVTPVGKLAIALTALDADKHYKRAVKDGVMSYSYWEVMDRQFTLLRIFNVISDFKFSNQSSRYNNVSNIADTFSRLVLEAFEVKY